MFPGRLDEPGLRGSCGPQRACPPARLAHAYRTAVGAAAVFLVCAALVAVVSRSFWTAVPLYAEVA
jgi:hypothetical protein